MDSLTHFTHSLTSLHSLHSRPAGKGVDAHWRLEWPGFSTPASFSLNSQIWKYCISFTQKEHPAPQEMKLRHKKLKIVLAMVILDFGYPSPQLHQTLKPMRELFCTGYPKRGRPSSSAPNLAKQSLLLVLPHHFTFLPPLNILVRQQFVLLHFFTFNFTFQFNNIALWLLTLLWEWKAFFYNIIVISYCILAIMIALNTGGRMGVGGVGGLGGCEWWAGAL